MKTIYHFSTFFPLDFTHAKSFYFYLEQARRSWEARKVFVFLKWIPEADIYYFPSLKSLVHVCLVLLVRLSPSTIQIITVGGI